jgi:hypothetical protein
MKMIGATALVLALASQAHVEPQTTIYAPDGRSLGTAVPDSAGNVRFYDSHGRSLGTSSPTGEGTVLRCGRASDRVRAAAAPMTSTAMPLPKAYLARKLAEPLPTTDGGVLRTIREARDYMLALPERRAIGGAWPRAAYLILNRAAAVASTRQRARISSLR